MSKYQADGSELNILQIIKILGNSLEVQWLGLSAFTAMAQVQSLVGELRSHKTRGSAKKKKSKTWKLYKALQLQ